MKHQNWPNGLNAQWSGHWPVRFSEAITDIDKEFSYWHGAPFDGLSLTKGTDGWLLVIRSHRHTGDPVVCFIGGDSAEACLLQWMETLASGAGIVWKDDRYRRT